MKEKIISKNKIYLLSFAVVVLLLVFFSADLAQAYKYEPMETIPGFSGCEGATANDCFPNYVKGVYTFLIVTVGISALLMISIGGFYYMTAAGNTSRIETGKGIIRDALFGMIVALLAWVILNVVNPDLTTINLESLPTNAPPPAPAMKVKGIEFEYEATEEYYLDEDCAYAFGCEENTDE